MLEAAKIEHRTRKDEDVFENLLSLREERRFLYSSPYRGGQPEVHI